MPLSDALLPEFDNEMAITRKCLERTPGDKLAWQPHQKSMSVGRLASHLAEIPSWGRITVEHESFDVAPPGGAPYQPRVFDSVEAILEVFDKNVSDARAAIAGVSDADLLKPWSLLQAGNTIFTMPRIGALRAFVFSHNVHHRGQFTVYLRLNEVPVPAIYGPSADEMGM